MRLARLVKEWFKVCGPALLAAGLIAALALLLPWSLGALPAPNARAHAAAAGMAPKLAGTIDETPIGALDESPLPPGADWVVFPASQWVEFVEAQKLLLRILHEQDEEIRRLAAEVDALKLDLRRRGGSP